MGADLLRAAWRVAVPAVLVVNMLGDAAANGSAVWKHWQSALHRDHPLAGRIWSSRNGDFLSPDHLVSTLAKARFVLLGETHDNPDHHRLQAWLIARLVEAGKRPAVVMEMIREDQSAILQSYLAKPKRQAAGLGEALEWEKTGWPDWRLYQPIAEAALAAGLNIVAGDASRERIRRISRDGLASLGQRVRAGLALDTEFAAPLANALLDELYDSHCRMMPREAMAALAGVQRFRDAVLAASLLRADAMESAGAILIAGNGHVRNDRGVPWYLARRAPEAKVMTVMLIEVDDKRHDPADLVPAGPDGRPATDFVWFTPRTEREDPCETLAERLGKGDRLGTQQSPGMR